MEQTACESSSKVRRRRGGFGVLLILLLLSASALPVLATPPPQGAPVVIDDAEILYQPDEIPLATGDPAGPETVYAWPFALESIGHLIESYQYYGGSPYFHHGLDIMAPAGTQVFNRSGGQVVNIENYQPGNSLYWEVAILDPEGYLWQYHHINQSTIPQYIWNKYYEYLADPINGGFIGPDNHIGNIVTWPVGYPGAPSNFHHIHLNILAANGYYLNGFAFHEPLADAAAPQIQAIGLLKNGQVYPGNTVEGSYGLYVRARDLVLAPNWYWLPPYEVKFSVDGAPEITVWRFDNLPGGGDRYAYVTDYYVVPPTCGNYDCNDFYIDLGFTPSGQREFPSMTGQHTVSVTVRDYVGNVASGQFTWTVLGPCVPPYGLDFAWTPAAPLPGDQVTFTGAATGSTPLTYSWAFGDGGTGTGNPVVHAYAAPGAYAATLTVSNACGSASLTKTVAVTAPPAGVLHLNRGKMNWAPAARPGLYKVVYLGRVHDQGHTVVPGASVTGEYTYPDTSKHTVTFVTTAWGQFKFSIKEPGTGLYQLCVTGMAKEGYTFDPVYGEWPLCMNVTVVP